MTLIHADTKLSDIVIADPTTVTVLNRFGITLGVGDLTVARACEKQQLDREFFTTILNTYVHADYFPQRILASFSAATIVDYLRKTNDYYAQFQIPNIERHFGLLINKSESANSNLTVMSRFFSEVKHELLDRIADDRTRWFPEILTLEANAPERPDTLVSTFDEGSDTIEDKLNDLISMFVIHLKGDYDLNLCQAVLIALHNLRKDIAQNDRIRNRILAPIVDSLAKHQPRS